MKIVIIIRIIIIIISTGLSITKEVTQVSVIPVSDVCENPKTSLDTLLIYMCITPRMPSILAKS